MTIRVSEVARPGVDWDPFVMRQESWTICHLAGWHDVMREVFGHHCMYMEARTDDVLTGVLPLVRIKSLLFGDYLVSMPFLNYGGPLGSPEAVHALVDAAARRAEELGVKLLQLRARTEIATTLPVSHGKITVVLDVPKNGADALWKRLDSKVRSQVRRPQKAGARVVHGHDQLDSFFDVFSRNMRDLGTPTQSRAFFEHIARVFGERVWFGCVYLGDRAVAAGCGFHWADEFEMTWASSLREFNNVSPNMLLYWSFMERAAGAAVTRFNFGRCTPGSGTHRFKKQWGASDEQLWWYHRARNTSSTRTPSPDAGPYAVAARLWRRLPLPLANALGPHIVRGIP